jgi:hypothetical protein
MLGYTKREAPRNYFSRAVKQKRHPASSIAAVRHVGPIWIVAGRHRRTIPVFLLRRRLLGTLTPAAAAIGGAE